MFWTETKSQGHVTLYEKNRENRLLVLWKMVHFSSVFKKQNSKNLKTEPYFENSSAHLWNFKVYNLKLSFIWMVVQVKMTIYGSWKIFGQLDG